VVVSSRWLCSGEGKGVLAELGGEIVVFMREGGSKGLAIVEARLSGEGEL
jgi:hypothetical protein